jgi:hypothetical protein
MSDIAISVVIAVGGDKAGLDDCLAALEHQVDKETEVIIVSTVDAPDGVAEKFPWAQWIKKAPACLIPALWGEGMSRATGKIVAITTAHFAMEPGWITTCKSAHNRLASPAIGGKINPPLAGSLVEWATYFLRYNRFLKFERESDVTDLPGENVSYKRSALETCRETLRDGFWEMDFHRQLLADGKQITFVKGMAVTQRASFGFLPFIRQRFRHGLRFGQDRLAGRGLLVRAVFAIGAPLIPVVFYGKIVLRVFKSGDNIGQFLLVTPVIFMFLLAWATGEALGYITLRAD